VSPVSVLFQDVIQQYAKMGVAYPHLKPVTIAQWAIESRRGTSALAIEHLNFGDSNGGAKWKGWPPKCGTRHMMAGSIIASS
jgi:hypothetical protein